MRPETVAAQALGRIDGETKAVIPPVHVATTFIRDPDNRYTSGYEYGRDDNATGRHGEAVLAALEGGASARLFASGMAAAGAVFHALPSGSHVIAPRVMYWALARWLGEQGPRLGLTVDFVEMDDLDAVRAAVRPETALIWAETPGNPTWVVTDLAAVAEIAREAGARLAVDSTVPTPVLTRPLELGADIVMHSATKYLNGHSDVVAGALVTARDDDFWQRICKHRAQTGPILGPMEAALLLRGMRTLHLRVHAACRGAMALAGHFLSHPQVSHVLYPGLGHHPGHAVAARQMQGGFGGMLSIRVAAGEAAAIATAAGVRIWKRATSLGGVESLIEHRASVEGEGSPAPPDMLRVSVGIENPADLIEDLEQALAAAT